MKLNSDESKKNVCKEEVLMNIFKDVPNFTKDFKKSGENIDDSWLGGSHHELLIGRQGAGRNEKILDDIESKSKTKKSKKNFLVGESVTELQLWSSPFLSEENISIILTKQKGGKQTKFNKHSQTVDSVMSTISTSQSNNSKKYFDKNLNKNDLCEDCQQLIDLSLSQDSLWFSLSEDEENDDELMRKWVKSSMKQLCRKDSLINLSYNKSQSNLQKKQVMKLLTDVQANLLECSILLTTNKLQKKAQSLAMAEDDIDLDRETPSDNDVLLDQIQAEESTNNNSSSKLCLALGKLAFKYLKIVK